MASFYPTRPEPSLSLPIRMEKKRKKTQAGSAALILGLGLLAGAGYCLTQSGSEVIAVYLTLFAIGGIVLGVSLLKKAAQER